MIQRLMLPSGLFALVAGLALFALSAGFNDSPSVYGQEGTSTAVVGTGTPAAGGTGTPAATRTAGPLTPVSTPTTGGAVGGESTLPSTGDGSASGGGSASLAIVGIALAMAGGTIAFLGARRRSA